MLTITIIAVGLAMDSFAVSVSSGIAIKNLRLRHALTIALFFGAFQAIMPVVGWLAGMGIKTLISNIDHWTAFGLLSFIGIKMIYESIKMTPGNDTENPLKLYTLLLLSVATSVDALAVGTTFALLDIVIIIPVIIIGLITFGFSFAGAYIGNRFGHFFENKIEIVGGLFLIGIGIKILGEHLHVF